MWKRKGVLKPQRLGQPASPHCQSLLRALQCLPRVCLDETADTRGRPAEGTGESSGAAAPETDHKRGSRIGPYRLLHKLGGGGMGTVWMVEQEHPLGHPAALKLINEDMDTAAVHARFETERKVLAMMDHD